MILFSMISLGDEYAYIKARNLECNGKKFCIDFYDLTHPECNENTIQLELHREQYNDPEDLIDYPLIEAGPVHI